MGKVLKLSQVCEILQLNRKTVVEKINKGELKATDISGGKKPNYRIKMEWLEDFLNGE